MFHLSIKGYCKTRPHRSYCFWSMFKLHFKRHNRNLATLVQVSNSQIKTKRPQKSRTAANFGFCCITPVIPFVLLNISGGPCTCIFMFHFNFMQKFRFQYQFEGKGLALAGVHDINTSRKRRRRDNDIRSTAAYSSNINL